MTQEQPPPPAPQASPEATLRGKGRWLLRFWAPISIVIISLLATVPTTLTHSRALSPIDEWVYVDYLNRLPEEAMVQQGERTTVETREQLACDGIILFGKAPAQCGGPYPDDAFPLAGKTTADGYTPLYFWMTFAATKVIELVTPFDFLTSARLTGTLWLAAGLLVFWRLARAFRVPDLLAVSIATCIAAMPLTWWSTTYVSTDAPAYLAGSLALLVGYRVYQRRWHPAWLVLVSALLVWLKVTHVIAVAAAALMMMGLAWFRRDSATETSQSDRKASLIAGALAVATAGLAQVSWMVVHGLIGVESGPDQQLSNELALGPLLDYTTDWMLNAPVSNLTRPDGSSLYPVPYVLEDALIAISIVGVVAPVLTSMVNGTLRVLRWPILLATLLAGPSLAIVLKVTGAYFPLPERYGAVLIPLSMLGLALFARARRAWVPIALVGAALIVNAWFFAGSATSF